jgi:hypothetical protein
VNAVAVDEMDPARQGVMDSGSGVDLSRLRSEIADRLAGLVAMVDAVVELVAGGGVDLDGP